MEKFIPNFEEFISLGYGAQTKQYGNVGFASNTGYDLKPIVTITEQFITTVTNEAKKYNDDEIVEHTKEDYLYQINEHLNDCFQKISENLEISPIDEEAKEWNVQDKLSALRKRNEGHKKGLESATKAEDKYKVEIYKTKLEIDKLDLSKLKLEDEIKKIEKERK